MDINLELVASVLEYPYQVGRSVYPNERYARDAAIREQIRKPNKDVMVVDRRTDEIVIYMEAE